MKTVAVVLLLALGCLAFANASPVPNRTSETKKLDGAQSRQAAAPAAPAPAEDEDDDDDDDDDDDIGGIADVEYDEDDEDDDAEDDDDDDEDYLERFIDDILGGEDDDDDDDETVAVVEPVQPASPVHTQATAIPASVQSDLNADEAANAADSAVEVNDSTGSYEEDVQPEGQAVSSLEGAESVANPVVVNQAAPVSTPSQTVDSDEDDDDDEDDDLDLDITEDEDSEEDDEEYEEDADEETDEIEDIADIADARRAREFKGKTKKHTNTRSRKHARGGKSLKKHVTPK